jgi:hypothetical protein
MGVILPADGLTSLMHNVNLARKSEANRLAQLLSVYCINLPDV